VLVLYVKDFFILFGRVDHFHDVGMQFEGAHFFEFVVAGLVGAQVFEGVFEEFEAEGAGFVEVADKRVYGRNIKYEGYRLFRHRMRIWSFWRRGS
jgi:hypothetical protein